MPLFILSGSLREVGTRKNKELFIETNYWVTYTSRPINCLCTYLYIYWRCDGSIFFSKTASAIIRRSCHELYPLIRPPGIWERNLIPGLIRSPLTLIVYEAAHCLPLGGVDRNFPFMRMRPDGISHASLVLLVGSLIIVKDLKEFLLSSILAIYPP